MTTRIRQLEGVGARKDYYHVDPLRIIVKDGWNPRTDFSGEEDLMASIIENGVQVPLRVRRGLDDTEIVLIDGERRLRAVLRALDEGNEIKSVPCIFERTGISDTEALLMSLITNQGKPLDATEEAGAFRRFVNWGMTVQDIAKRIGKSAEFVRQRLTLVDAAPAVKTAVKNGEISIAQGVSIVKESHGDPDQQQVALAQAPTKNARSPKRSTFQTIKDRAAKLSRGQLLDLIGYLSAMADEMKEVEEAE
jgi:ParB family chromosome partitioning protein